MFSLLNGLFKHQVRTDGMTRYLELCLNVKSKVDSFVSIRWEAKTKADLYFTAVIHDQSMYRPFHCWHRNAQHHMEIHWNQSHELLCFKCVYIKILEEEKRRLR